MLSDKKQFMAKIMAIDHTAGVRLETGHTVLKI